MTEQTNSNYLCMITHLQTRKELIWIFGRRAKSRSSLPIRAGTMEVVTKVMLLLAMQASSSAEVRG